jgi:hypothetical protein
VAGTAAASTNLRPMTAKRRPDLHQLPRLECLPSEEDEILDSELFAVRADVAQSQIVRVQVFCRQRASRVRAERRGTDRSTQQQVGRADSERATRAQHRMEPTARQEPTHRSEFRCARARWPSLLDLSAGHRARRTEASGSSSLHAAQKRQKKKCWITGTKLNPSASRSWCRRKMENNQRRTPV